MQEQWRAAFYGRCASAGSQSCDVQVSKPIQQHRLKGVNMLASYFLELHRPWRDVGFVHPQVIFASTTQIQVLTVFLKAHLL